MPLHGIVALILADTYVVLSLSQVREQDVNERKLIPDFQVLVRKDTGTYFIRHAGAGMDGSIHGASTASLRDPARIFG
jgi:hypothetical protein